jgi:hypothetical protein
LCRSGQRSSSVILRRKGRAMKSRLVGCLILVAALLGGGPAQAGVMSKALRETFEFMGRKFGRQVLEEGAERVSVRMTRLASQHGEELVGTAFRKVGPRAGRLVEEAGDRGGLALRLLARRGEEAIPLIARPSALAKVARYGDEAAVAIIKHGTVGEQLVGQFAKEGAEALAKVTPRQGRRLAMMAAKGELKPELMQVISRYGNPACDFIWRNKGALAVGATLTAFVTSPGPFLEGTQKLTSAIADATMKPLAVGVANNTNWTLLAVIGTAILVVLGYLRGVLSGTIPLWHSVRPGSDSHQSNNNHKPSSTPTKEGEPCRDSWKS